MDLSVAKKVFKDTDQQRMKIRGAFAESARYYNNENDITKDVGGQEQLEAHAKDDALRQADNRISNGYHRILVDQKAQYVGGIAPAFDVGDDTTNNKVLETLGDNFARIFQRLVIDASNAGTGWVHYWRDPVTNEFHYATLDPAQIIPIYDGSLEQKLLAVRRTYEELNPEDGERYIYDEYWTDKEAQFFKRQKGRGYDYLDDDYRVAMFDTTTASPLDNSNILQHEMGAVPFIPFMNNQDGTPDLKRYKGLIDVYDRIYSGFVNDVDDVQQIILILTNYGEAGNAQEFKQKLQRDGVINLEKYGDGDQSGLDKLAIDIPIQAREALLDRTRESIFLHGQGVDPLKVDTGSNKSGVALKMIYTLLELKSSALESEFRPALAELIRAVLRYLNDGQADTRKIAQTWTRAAVKDETEQAEIVAKLADVTSTETIAKSNPLVEDWQDELKLREEEKGGGDSFENKDAENKFGDDPADDDEDDEEKE